LGNYKKSFNVRRPPIGGLPALRVTFNYKGFAYSQKGNGFYHSFLFSINRNETTKMRNQLITTKNLKKLKIMQILLLLKLSRLIIESIG
jgi:hypothetical protein